MQYEGRITDRTAVELHAGNDIGALLSPLEWRVAMLARSEADRFRCWASQQATPGVFKRLIRILTGIESGVKRLADDRLEALRQFVCSARRGDRATDGLAATLVTLGFAPEAIARVRAFARQGLTPVMARC